MLVDWCRLQLSWLRSISQISIRNICVTEANTDTDRTSQCLLACPSVVMKFLSEVSHVSPYFKVHWTKCSFSRGVKEFPSSFSLVSSQFSVVIYNFSQKAICQNILNWCKAITSTPRHQHLTEMEII